MVVVQREVYSWRTSRFASDAIHLDVVEWCGGLDGIVVDGGDNAKCAHALVT